MRSLIVIDFPTGNQLILDEDWNIVNILKDESYNLAEYRFGATYIHYCLAGDGGLVFPSEIKSIFTTCMIEEELDYRSIFYCFSLIYIPAPHSICKNIRKVLFSRDLIYKHGTVVVKECWDNTYKPDSIGSEGNFPVALREGLVSFIKDRLIIDPHLRAFKMFQCSYEQLT